MKSYLIAGMLVFATGCATTPVPTKRPLNQSAMDVMGETDIVLAENNNGVTASWFMQDSSSAGAGYGLIGALVTATMDAVMNAAPAKRAARSADALSEYVLVDAMNASLVEGLKSQKISSGDSEISIGSVSTTQKILTPDAVDDAVELSVSYTLSEDASALRVFANAVYENDDIAYVTPYDFEKSVPKTETVGPLYRNTFTYESDAFPVPELTPELKEEMVVAIKESYMDDSGNPPAEDSDEFKAMNKEIEKANDDKLKKSEAAIFQIRKWLKDDGAPMKREIENAHSFIAKYVVADMNSTDVPSMEGEDKLVEELANSRTVRMIGSGLGAGSYVSSPGNVSDFTTYGNAVSIAKVNRERAKELRSDAKAAKKAAKDKS